MKRLRALWSMTSVRLSLVYTLVFGLFAVALITYTTTNTARLLLQQTRKAVEAEINDLERIYRLGNMARLIRVIERRSRAPGASLYLISDRSGRIIAGNVRDIEPGILAKKGWTQHPFHYQGYGQSGGPPHQAIARVFDLPGGLRALIGRDMGQPDRFRLIARRSLIIALGIMVLLGFLTSVFVGRRALKRIDSVAKSTRRIMAGDLNERLPLSGSGDEFDRLSGSLNQLLGRITRLDEGLKQVSDNIAHDLKTPLTRLRNKAEQTLSGDPQKQQYRKAMQEVIEESDNLIKVFNALLMIARVEAGSHTGDFTSLDIAEVVQDVHELYDPVAEEVGVAFTLETENAVTVRGNRELFGQAIANLIDNAIKYAVDAENGEPQVSLKVKQQKNRAIIEVADNGPGIPDGELERVKERFIRLDESRSKQGTGLGLSLVDAVVRLHVGTFTLGHNNPGLIAEVSIPLEK